MRCDFCAGEFTYQPIRIDDGCSMSNACYDCVSFNKRETFVKHDHGKPKWSLLPKEAVEEVIRVLEHGAEKYGAFNWRKGTEWTRYIDAAMRHLSSFSSGEDNDSESKRSHLAHAACCCLFLIDFILHSRGMDNRVKDNK